MFLKALRGEACHPHPVWFMRQAGRYLPEYRAVREKAGSFLDLCFSPEMAADVTLQPIRRYDLDAAILFADILLMPMVLGQDLAFESGEGPKLSPALGSSEFDPSLLRNMDIVAPVYETVRLVRAGLAKEKALIGFAGAPWTVATYMIAGHGVKDTAALRRFAYDQPDRFAALISALEDVTIEYLCGQVAAGADALQLFESWASGLPADFVRQWCLAPAARIAGAVKKRHPGVPVLAFPKGAGSLYLDFAAEPVFDGLSLGTEVDWQWARDNLSAKTLQGGLDPLLVAAGGDGMRDAARRLRDTFAGSPYIFNLGHGFVPDTPPENVAELVSIIRE
ncbi:uroporphyrinogen decarboxylase [Aquisalinus flavus]|nr:uroporphyrinogen decarboxylase [Aquisalinus flavus]